MTPLNSHAAIAYLKVEELDESRPTVALSHDDSPVLRRLPGGLLVAYLVDVGDAFQYVQHRDLRDAALTEEQLHAIGLANLRSQVGTSTQIKPYRGIFAVLAGGNFEASLILLDDFWSTQCEPLCPNGIVAAFPSRDVLAFGDANSPRVLDELHAMCERLGPNPDHALTSTIFRRNGTTWLPHASRST